MIALMSPMHHGVNPFELLRIQPNFALNPRLKQGVTTIPFDKSYESMHFRETHKKTFGKNGHWACYKTKKLLQGATVFLVRVRPGGLFRGRIRRS